MEKNPIVHTESMDANEAAAYVKTTKPRTEKLKETIRAEIKAALEKQEKKMKERKTEAARHRASTVSAAAVISKLKNQTLQGKKTGGKNKKTMKNRKSRIYRK